jgi:glutamate dehydrogenase
VHGPDIIAVARATGRPVLELARGFFLLGERLEIDWLESQLEQLTVSTRWQVWAKQSMEHELFAARRVMCERVLEEGRGASIDAAVETFLESHAEPAARLRRFMRGLAVEGVNDLAQLTVALRQIRALTE